MSTIAEPIHDLGNLDPISFEVIRNKLSAIAEEQAITLKAVSGSPVVTEATDFNNGIYLADGSTVTMGPQVLFHSGTMSSVIKNVIAQFSENPGIRPGDMFILNDPYRGAVHQPDVAIVAPLFDGERLIAWAGSCAHQLDIGGMSFGSWAVDAYEIQQEAMLLPGVKIVEGGEIREDIWQMIMGMTRLPMVLGLDLKAMIAANNVAARRLAEVMERYGTERVLGVMEAEIEASERRFRARLLQLPDGIFRAVDFLEHDGHDDLLYEVRLAVHKQADELVFDFEGSSPQAPGFINCTRSGLVGAVFTALLPILAPDIRWNHGILHPVEVRAPEASIINASWPAPVSSGTVSAVWVATNVSVAAISRLAACSAATSSEAAAITKGSMMVLTLAGQDRDGGPYGTFVLDSTAGGGGAYADHDGISGSGDYCVPRPSIANVESNEAGGPLLYLYRRLVPDTAGPGRHRGGAAVGLALTPHDVDELGAMLISHGVEVPNSAGLFGGMEAACNDPLLLREGEGTIGRVLGPDALRAITGTEETGPKPGHFPLRAGEVFAYSFQGGGGFGDPLDRDPEAVLADVIDGLVSPVSAHDHYGVVVEDGELDLAATAARRKAIRAERLGSDPSREVPVDPSATGEPLGPYLTRGGDGRLHCRCGEDLGASDGDWKRGAARRLVRPEDHGRRIRLHPELELREFSCPACATLLECEVGRVGESDLHSIELHK
ncbi:MAG: hydantoinase B/oxoprolinase family protein [Actinobacteria bacterium]|nr:hydantoinase B/oxoprolinase family protein [Actinomycetota bacterium]